MQNSPDRTSAKSAQLSGALLATLGMTILGGSVTLSRLILDYPTFVGQALRYALAAAVLAGLAVSVLPESGLRPGMRVLTARDGVDAMEMLQEHTPDIILLDIEMPRMDGYELTATLRGQQAFQQVPVVILTSRAGEKHRRKAFELGATEYLVKPFQDDTLRDVVRRVTREAAGALPA